MSTLDLPDETPPPEVADESPADADLRDLTGEIERKLQMNGHQVQTNRYTGWSRMTVQTPQGFTFDLPLVLMDPQP